MSPRSGIRKGMAAGVEARQDVESPMERKERHRRFLENRRRRTTGRGILEARNYDGKKEKNMGGLHAEGTGTSSESSEDNKNVPPPPPPPTETPTPTSLPPAQATPALATKPVNTFIDDIPINKPLRKGAEPPATSAPPPAGSLSPPPPPPPEVTPLPPPPPPPPATTSSSSSSRSLSIATPITHAPFTPSPTPEAPQATPPAPVAGLPIFAPSSPPPAAGLPIFAPSQPPPASSSSTFITSTSVPVASPTSLLSSISTTPVPIPEATPPVPQATPQVPEAAPPSVTPVGNSNPNADAKPATGKKVDGASTTPFATGTAAPNARETPALGAEPEVIVTRKDNRTRTIGITVGVIVGSLALIFLAWCLIGRKTRQLRKKRDEEHEKTEVMFASDKRGSSVAESTIWRGAATTVPNTAAPSVAGGFPAALPSYPVYTNQTTYPPTVTTPTMPAYDMPKPTFAAAPLNLRRSEPEPEPEPEPELDEGRQPASWRDSIATMSTIVSVARFRTVKSWAWDQRKRNMADSKIPDIPDMPANASYRQLDD